MIQENLTQVCELVRHSIHGLFLGRRRTCGIPLLSVVLGIPVHGNAQMLW